MAIELEAKFVLGGDVTLPPLAAPGAVLTSPERELLETSYWDTPDHALAASGCSLRFRSGQRWTAKRGSRSGGALLQRREQHFDGGGTRPPEDAIAFLSSVGHLAELRASVLCACRE